MTGGAAPRYRTGVIWGVLTLFLVLGSVACAFFAYGLSEALTTHAYLLDGAIMVVAAGAALWLVLLVVGLLYRIDRLRGVAHRRIELFE
jgi:hypothetical protein